MVIKNVYTDFDIFFRIAKLCNAVSHCEQTFWSKLIDSPDPTNEDGQTQNICAMHIDNLKSIISHSSNMFSDNDFCSDFFDDNAKSVCQSTVSLLKNPDFKDILSSIDSGELCTIISDLKKADLSFFFGKNKCETCQRIVDFALMYGKNPFIINFITEKAVKLCAIFMRGNQRNCEQGVRGFMGMVAQFIINVRSQDVCGFLRICPRALINRNYILEDDFEYY